MLCTHCEGLVAELARQATPTPHARPRGRDLVHTLLCDRCGSVVLPPDPATSTGGKLSQLARFGLAAGAQPLLERRVAGTGAGS